MDAAIARDLASRGLDAEFWRGLDNGELRLPLCASCERWVWPAECRCGECGSFEWRWPVVPAEGVVYSWTRTWYPFVEDRAEDLPYVIVLVEIPHAGRTRLLGILTGDETGLAVGAALSGEVAPGTDATGYLPSLTWRLAGSGSDA